MNYTHMHILSTTHQRFKLLTAIEEEKINEKAQVWLQHFISCLFHALGAFHQTPYVHKRNQKQT